MRSHLEAKLAQAHASLSDLHKQAADLDQPLLAEALTQLGTALEELEVTVEALQASEVELEESRRRVETYARRYTELFDHAPDAYLVTDVEGVIGEANHAAGEMLGITPGRLAGKPLTLYVTDDEREPLRRFLAGLAGHEEISRREFTIAPRTGERVIVEARVETLRLLTGELVEVRWLLRDITARAETQRAFRRDFAEAKRERQRLEDLDSWKNAFIAAAAHDLRAPLVDIGMAAQLLSDKVGEDGARWVDVIIEASERAERLLGDLLDLDRFTRGVMTLERDDVDLAKAVSEAVEHVRLGDHAIEFDLDDVRASVEPGRVRQIVQNLVRNIVQHTPSDTRIWVRARQEREEAIIVVEDDGPGIPEGKRDVIFEPFTGDGSGLGLTLVSLFAEMHDGTVCCDERPGGGARFTVRVPRHAPTAG